MEKNSRRACHRFNVMCVFFPLVTATDIKIQFVMIIIEFHCSFVRRSIAEAFLFVLITDFFFHVLNVAELKSTFQAIIAI